MYVLLQEALPFSCGLGMLPPVGLVMLSVVIYFVIMIAPLLPQSSLAVTIFCHLVRCSRVSSNQCTSMHPQHVSLLGNLVACPLQHN